MNTQLLIFDLDGTLIDTMKAYADKAAALIFEHYGTPGDEAHRRCFETSGLPFEQQLEQMVFIGDSPNDARIAAPSKVLLFSTDNWRVCRGRFYPILYWRQMYCAVE